MTDVDVRSPGSVDSAEHKRKHIVWNEDNLSYNEANKSVSRRARRTRQPQFVHPPPLFSSTPRSPAPSRAVHDRPSSERRLR